MTDGHLNRTTPRPHLGEGGDGGPFRALVEAGADAVLVVSAGGTIQYANPAAGALLGRPSGGLNGQPFGVPVVVDGASEVDLRRADGGGRVAEMRAVPLEWDGRPAYLASLRDVTDRKRAETGLQEANRRKDEFLAMLAHELRNPLAPVRNAVHILRRHLPADGPGRPVLDMAERQVEHMARLLDDLLDVSRVTHGAIRLQKGPLDVADVVARAVETSRPHIDARGHQFDVEIAPGPYPIDGDPARLVQVVSNLLNNAAKYTPDGGRITLALGREGNNAVVRVRDNGTGIQPDLLPCVFDTFTQGTRTLARSEGGLGLGLALVKSLTELHGGTVHAASDGPARGAEFEVRLPLAPRAVQPARPPDAGQPAAAAPTRRVLVVDDNRDAADSLALLLELAGHAVRVAYDGPAALRAAAAARPELVFLDIGLPGLDGYQVAAALRERPETSAARLVAVSGYGREDDKERGRRAGFDDHLVKPVDLAAVERCLAAVSGPPPRS